MESISGGLVLLAQSGAAGTTTSTAVPTAPPAEPSSFNPQMLAGIVILFVAFFFLIQRPQQRAEKQKALALSGMKKGDKVISAGGIHGVVTKVNIEAGTVLVQVSKGVELEFNKGSLNVQVEKVEEKKSSEKAAS